MRWGSVYAGLARGLTASLIAGPAFAEPAALAQAASIAASKSIQSFWDVAPARPGLRVALTDRLELAASARRHKSPGEQFGRRAEGLAGRSRNPKMARVGLTLRW